MAICLKYQQIPFKYLKIHIYAKKLSLPQIFSYNIYTIAVISSVQYAMGEILREIFFHVETQHHDQ